VVKLGTSHASALKETLLRVQAPVAPASTVASLATGPETALSLGVVIGAEVVAGALLKELVTLVESLVILLAIALKEVAMAVVLNALATPAANPDTSRVTALRDRKATSRIGIATSAISLATLLVIALRQLKLSAPFRDLLYLVHVFISPNLLLFHVVFILALRHPLCLPEMCQLRDSSFCWVYKHYTDGIRSKSKHILPKN